MITPVGVSTYVRVGHLRQTVSALAANTLAGDTELFIFSDAPRPGDEAKVEEVRRFARTIKGFRRIEVVTREENDRVYNNREGLRRLLQEYGRTIFLEEDIVTSRYFLEFMNRSLEKYRDDSRIFAICGYTPPVDFPRLYFADVYLCRRFAAWGFGTWSDRFQGLDLQRSGYEELRGNPEALKVFSRIGEDALRMLEKEWKGELDALDVKIWYHQFAHGQFVVAPVQSLTNNIGHDGTGLHCQSTKRFEVVPNDTRVPVLPKWFRLRYNRRIERVLYQFRSGIPRISLKRKLWVFVRDVLGLRR